MTLRHMRIFQKIYENQSVTRAAEELHMTQPAVTRALQELERYYGLRLFERLGRRLTVTEAGRRMYDYALHLTETFESPVPALYQSRVGFLARRQDIVRERDGKRCLRHPRAIGQLADKKMVPCHQGAFHR